ncbi:hypothetical protein AHAS_Ahas11G0261200 [Arachis hypogaea]
MYNFAKKLWIGFVPPRVELLTWFIILGRLNTKDRLCNLKMLRSEDVKCVLCGSNPEAVHHIFFACD